MSLDPATPSARREELLEAAYAYVLQHGISDLSLRPLATAIGSSPRVLLYLFGSKEGLVQALLARARVEELSLLSRLHPNGATGGGLVAVAEHLWAWLAAPEHQALLALWVEAYARSLTEPDGPWQSFAASTVHDWLTVLTTADDPPEDDSTEDDSTVDDSTVDDSTVEASAPAPTAVLALLRGALLDLLATGDVDRTTAAVHGQLHLWRTTGHVGRD